VRPSPQSPAHGQAVRITSDSAVRAAALRWGGSKRAGTAAENRARLAITVLLGRLNMPDDIINFESEKHRRAAEIDNDYWESVCGRLTEIMGSSSSPAAVVRAGLLAMLNRLEQEGMSRSDAKAFIVQRLTFIE